MFGRLELEGKEEVLIDNVDRDVVMGSEHQRLSAQFTVARALFFSRGNTGVGTN